MLDDTLSVSLPYRSVELGITAKGKYVFYHQRKSLRSFPTSQWGS